MIRLFILFLIISLFSSCNDLQLDDSLSYPVIEMMEVTDIDATGATLNAIVHYEGNKEILRSSFNWSLQGVEHFFGGDQFLIDISITNNKNISARINRNLMPNYWYDARFIVELEGRKIISNAVRFQSKGATIRPININARQSVFVSAAAFYGFEKLNVPGFSNSIYEYNDASNEWLKVSEGFSKTITNGIFGYDNNKIFSLSKFTEPTMALWELDSWDNEFEKVGDFLPQSSRKFFFIIDGIGYTTQNAENMVNFDLNNYNGIEETIPLPFSTNEGSRFYGFGVKNSGYVFFSEKDYDENNAFEENQFWKYNKQSNSWNQLPNFPGTGYNLFSTSTDGQRYIYIGLGMSPYINLSTNRHFAEDGDLWRFDTENESWEHLGWIPKEAEYFTFLGIQEANGKNFIVCYLNNGLTVTEIISDEIPEL